MDSRAERNKRRVNPYLILLLVILLGSGGISLLLINNKNDSTQVQEKADTFIHILEDKEYGKLGDVLEKQSYNSLGYTLKDVIDKYDHIFNGINIHNIHASKITLKKINNNEQDLSYQLSFTTPLGRLDHLNYHTKIIKTNHHYWVYLIS